MEAVRMIFAAIGAFVLIYALITGRLPHLRDMADAKPAVEQVSK